MATNEEVKLVNESTFVNVYYIDDNFTLWNFYGGNQEWYADVSEKNNGCGPVAAANITAYLAQKDSSKYGNLYNLPSTAKHHFLKHMYDLYDALDPGIFGVYSLIDFKTRVESFALTRGVSLSDNYIFCNDLLYNVSEFIKYGLSQDCPVACLNLQITYLYGYHWMTITKYFRDAVTDDRWIAVSTWGERRSINFKEYYDSAHTWGGGFVFFY